MNILIIGLGNPGEQYSRTRHNAGFLFADYLVNQRALSWKAAKKVNGLVADFRDTDLHLIVAKPQTYMNLSGESVRVLKKLYPNHTMYVAHDDLDITLGAYKIQNGIGPKVHNGLSSIENHIHDTLFLRIRIGIDNRRGDRSLTGEQYVLRPFPREEYDALQDIFPLIEKQISGLLD